MKRLRDRTTGVVVNVDDDKPMGARWEPLEGNASSGGSQADGHVCDVCGFVAKSASGLGAHSRTHDEE